MNRSQEAWIESSLPKPEDVGVFDADPSDAKDIVWSEDCDWGDGTHETTDGDSKIDPSLGGCDDPKHEEERSDESEAMIETHPDRAAFTASEDSLSRLAPFADDRIQDRSLFSIYAAPSLLLETRIPIGSSSNAQAASGRAGTYHYFSTLSAAGKPLGPSLKTEPLARDATQETYVSFPLLELAELDEMVTTPEVADTAPRPTVFAVGLESASAAVLKDDATRQHEAQAIQAAERALRLATKMVDTADAARDRLSLNGATTPSSNRDSLRPTGHADCCAASDMPGAIVPPNANDSLRGNLKLGLVGMVSILFSIRSTAPDRQRQWERVANTQGRPLRRRNRIAERSGGDCDRRS
ncbi:hypothetical protein [Rosistilla carotiformis]|uniref:hypothetical protein n=1 Tax=Rosistilla carotiformis TaxID=2528017 RepID=UPI0011A2A2FD|nr:hypothetical protein [Rosistilla carotiformis]